MPDETRYADVRCPKCGTLMRLVAIEPAWSVLGADEITYQCGACNQEQKRIRQADKP
jgi:DNA-directed RNA polymerase subunit RPC12/RpoP